jgi:hypothetical protein
MPSFLMLYLCRRDPSWNRLRKYVDRRSEYFSRLHGGRLAILDAEPDQVLKLREKRDGGIHNVHSFSRALCTRKYIGIYATNPKCIARYLIAFPLFTIFVTSRKSGGEG